MTPTNDWVENLTYDELSLGQSAVMARTITLDTGHALMQEDPDGVLAALRSALA